jgi:hypothetical protein
MFLNEYKKNNSSAWFLTPTNILSALERKKGK